MAAIGSWGGSGIFQIDFSMNILYGNPANPMQAFTQASGYYAPDCDTTPFPQLPPGGGIEGQEGNALPYSCDTSQNDCHLLIYQGHWLFEMYQATTGNGIWDGGLTSLCEVAWDLTHDYWTYGATPYSRGDQCTSTDAAGMPVAPLLVTRADLQSGVVAHALRFILPNASMQAGLYLHPGTHAGGPSGASPLPIYGSRFRLKSSFNVSSLPNAYAQAVAVALQTYGMFLDDGGNIPLTFDQSAQAYIGSHDLSLIQVSDFELIDSPDPAVSLTDNCQRTQLTSTN
jgi:serine/threonine-protein kinase